MTSTALVFPEPGTPPIRRFVYIRFRVTTLPRGSNPNGNSSNMSTRPSDKSGQMRRFALAGSCLATHSTHRPGCASGSVPGDTAVSGRRIALAGNTTDQEVRIHQVQGDDPATGIKPKRELVEHVDAAVRQERPDAALRLGRVLFGDPQHAPAGMRVRISLWPHRGERTPHRPC